MANELFFAYVQGMPWNCIQEGVFLFKCEPEPTQAEDTPPCLSWIQIDTYYIVQKNVLLSIICIPASPKIWELGVVPAFRQAGIQSCIY